MSDVTMKGCLRRSCEYSLDIFFVGVDMTSLAKYGLSQKDLSRQPAGKSYRRSDFTSRKLAHTDP